VPPKNDLSVQVDSKSASLVNDKFRSLFHVGAPLADDPPALVGAVLACFREAVRSNEASSFVPSLKGGSMPDLGLLARPRPAGPAGDVSPTPAPAGPAGDVVSNLTGASSVEERVGGGGAGPAGGMPLSAARGGPSGSEGWRALDAHNVAGPMVTHPVQLLAYHLATRPGCDKRLLRGEGGILAAFGASHINDLHKNLKPKERAKRYSVFW